MPSTSSLEHLVSSLNQQYSSREKRRAFWRECRHNLHLEALCITACECGEFGSEFFAYTSGWEDINTPGLVGGITLGLLYALTHTYSHGRRHQASWRDAVHYALTTESGCVISATGVEYLLGLATARDPLSGTNLLIRGAGLVPAFGLGLMTMSALTFFKLREAGSFQAPSCALPIVYDHAKQSAGMLTPSLRGRRLHLSGTAAALTIAAKEIDSNHSLYRVLSPVCRYDGAARSVFRDGVSHLFQAAGYPITFIQDKFRHA